MSDTAPALDASVHRARLSVAKFWRSRQTEIAVELVEVDATPAGTVYVTHQRADRPGIEVVEPAADFLAEYDPILPEGMAA